MYNSLEMVKTHYRYPYPEINYLETSSISFMVNLRNRQVFFMFQKENHLCWRKTRFLSNIQLRILPIKKFRVGKDAQKVITRDFCFTNVPVDSFNEEEYFLEWFVIFNKLSIIPWFILGKKSFSNPGKLALFLQFF